MTECQDGNDIFKANPCTPLQKNVVKMMIRTSMKSCEIIAVKYSQEKCQNSSMITEELEGISELNSSCSFQTERNLTIFQC